MAKQMGHQQAITFDSIALTNANGGCVVGSPAFSRDVDMAVSACAGGTHKTHYAGLTDSSITFDMEIETDAITLLDSTLAVGNTGAFQYDPFGSTSGDVRITSTNGTVAPWTLNAPINGMVAVSFQIMLDDFTVAAIP